jgi:hypothetical protein
VLAEFGGDSPNVGGPVQRCAVEGVDKVVGAVRDKVADELAREMQQLGREAARELLGEEGREPRDFVQQFAQFDTSGSKMVWLDIIRKATEVLSRTTMRRITVTDPWGGRGHDFDVKDEEANNNGGMLVIAMLIPKPRDFTQWKGRTARSDRNGQYSAILCKLDAPVKDFAELGFYRNENGSYKEELIEKLLEEQDKDTKTLLAQKDEEITSGLRLNELCDQFHEKFLQPGGGPVETWPRAASRAEDNKLSDFLSSNKSKPEEIQEFKDSVGLTYTSRY